jgi:hypothetical protein
MFMPLSSTSGQTMQHMHRWQKRLLAPAFPSNHHLPRPGASTCALIVMLSSADYNAWPKMLLPQGYNKAAPSVPLSPSTHAQSRWLGTPQTFSGKTALKVSIILAAKRFWR